MVRDPRLIRWITAFSVRRALSDGEWLTAPAVAECVTGHAPNGDTATMALQILKGLRAAGVVEARAEEVDGGPKLLWGLVVKEVRDG